MQPPAVTPTTRMGEVVKPIGYQSPILVKLCSLAELKHQFGGRFLTLRACLAKLENLHSADLAELPFHLAASPSHFDSLMYTIDGVTNN